MHPNVIQLCLNKGNEKKERVKMNIMEAKIRQQKFESERPRQYLWPLTLKIDRATRPFPLNLTCNIESIDMRHDFKKDNDMRQGYLSNWTFDM